MKGPRHRGNADSGHIAFAWLLHLRWAAVACQLAVVGLVAWWLRLDLPVGILFLFIAFQAVSNAYFHYLYRRVHAIPTALLGGVLLWDVVHLSLLLHYSGGPMNPFTFLYLVHVALGAVLMPPAWAWTLALATIVAYAALFPLAGFSLLPLAPAGRPVCIDLVAQGHDPAMLGMHLQGMWAAFAISALFIVLFIGRIQKALAEHRRRLARLGEEKAKSDRLAALATLAAGAAHEFSTPLATIAVAAGEMLHALQREKAHAQVVEDARLIRQQVQRCRRILDQLAADAGEHAGAPIEHLPLAELLDLAAWEFQRETGTRVVLEDEAGDLEVALPVETFARTLKGLLKNGADAGGGKPVVLRSRLAGGTLVLEVEDQGPGMDEETRQRAGEPFFTTKPAGKGMGLGLFLARTMAEQYGGTMTIDTPAGGGCRVALHLPLARLTPNDGGADHATDPHR